MISSLHVRLRWLRRKLSRTHLAAAFLGIRTPKGEADQCGLILIQVDGLSRAQFERAVERHRLPFLSRMLRRGHFQAEDFYSGVPSTTPAVQGEVFYGKRTAVPAFQFLERGTGRVFRMYEAESARCVEERLRRDSPEPLLAGGHSYSNIYTAGAAESRYCSQDLSVDTLIQRLHPAKTLLLCLTHSVRIFRMIGLALLEGVLALVDFVKGLYEKKDFWKELAFVPARIVICIVLREAIRFRVLLDIEKGVRLIHANFLGYDEQAHRRGPGSAFAHWTLKGIDRAIRDIHRAAARSPFREYEMIVYSDHGQEETTPYERAHGRLIEEALAEVFSRGPAADHPVWSSRIPAPLGGTLDRWLSLLKLESPPTQCADPRSIVLTALGPLAHLYLPIPLDEAQARKYALELVRGARVPLVLLPARGGEAPVFNARGAWSLPRDAAEVLGNKHPFRDAVARDLVALATHPDAGDFILSGWSPHEPPVTFPLENGGHGGPGPEETRGFILLPERIDRWHHDRGPDRGKPIRGTTLHRIVRHFLHEDPVWSDGPHMEDPCSPRPLRVATYNVHSCVGLDGRNRPDRIARVINSLWPDVIALQEVDVHRGRSGRRDQPHEIARWLRMEHVFHSMLEEHDERYGIAILSRHPLKLMRKDLLTAASRRRPFREARGAIWVRIHPEGFKRPLHFIATHFGLGRDERREQAEVLLGDGWLGAIPEDEPVILCGDFNSGRRSVVWQRIHQRLGDAQLRLREHRARPTFPSSKPLVSLDHIFVSHHFRISDVIVADSPMTVVASDHLPLLAELAPQPELQECSGTSNATPANSLPL